MSENRTHIYMASDMHFGAPSFSESLVREKHFVHWLKSISPRTSDLYLLGDLFDFWFEYKEVVPKGYVRFLGQLAEMVDAGIKIHIFPGNHDLWYKDFFPQYIGAKVYEGPIVQTLLGHKMYLAHGDGLGPGDQGYKFLRMVSTHPLSKWLFARLHPNFGIGLANYFSHLSRKQQEGEEEMYFGEREFLFQHSLDMLKTQPGIQYFVYGHRHLKKQLEIAPGKTLFFLGDWIRHYSFLEITEEKVELKSFLP